MVEKIAIFYWCEGAGHAARSMPIAKELESRGHEVVISGGGPGEIFADINNYETEDFPIIELTEKKREKDFSKLNLVKELIFSEIPKGFKRLKAVSEWLEKEDPDKLVTDDPFAVIAASIKGVEFYRIEHVLPEALPVHTRLAAKLYNSFSLLRGEKIFFTSLWDPEMGGDRIRVGPLAQEGEDDVDEFDVLLMPGSWSTCFDEIREELEDQELDVRMVGDDDWELVPAMTPYTGAADVVVCTGFSSIADSVVAGTPCVVFPFISFQEGLSAEIEKKDIKGVDVAYSLEEVLEKVQYFRENQGEKPEFQNGAKQLVDFLLEEDK